MFDLLSGLAIASHEPVLWRVISSSYGRMAATCRQKMWRSVHFLLMPRELSVADRHFFGLVSRAAFSTPFGRERDALDRAIAEVAGDAPDLVARVVARVEQRLTALEASEGTRLAVY